MPLHSKNKITLSGLLDENFECLNRVALAICETLRRPKDRQLARSTLAEMARLHNSHSIAVKRNVRKFMRFYLKVLRWTQTHQPVRLYEKWYGNKEEQTFKDGLAAPQEEMHSWLEQGRSYLAMKHFADGSTMIYSAVCKDSTNGWAENGLKTMAKQVKINEDL